MYRVVLEEAYHAAISQYSSPQQVGNKRDDIPRIVRKMNEVITHIGKDEMILTYCLQMRRVKERNLFQKAVETSVFSGLLAGVCGLNAEQMYDIMVRAPLSMYIIIAFTNRCLNRK